MTGLYQILDQKCIFSFYNKSILIEINVIYLNCVSELVVDANISLKESSVILDENPEDAKWWNIDKMIPILKE